jgi:hypothetical protein
MAEHQQSKTSRFQRWRERRRRAKAERAKQIHSRPKEAPADRWERSGGHKSGGRDIGPAN